VNDISTFYKQASAKRLPKKAETELPKKEIPLHVRELHQRFIQKILKVGDK
jgi:hypothetical protein